VVPAWEAWVGRSGSEAGPWQKHEALSEKYLKEKKKLLGKIGGISRGRCDELGICVCGKSPPIPWLEEQRGL
jgi:hypothetical protein